LKYLKVVDGFGYFWGHVQCVNWIPEIHFSTEEYSLLFHNVETRKSKIRACTRQC
jgi:hypothetical protein